jgi:excisionase family DNA binding protein
MAKRINKIKFYLTEEISDILGLSEWSVRKYIHSGRIHAIKIGSAWHISNESLNEFLKTGGMKKVKEEKDLRREARARLHETY